MRMPLMGGVLNQGVQLRGYTNPRLHNSSAIFTNSKFTSWTTDRNIAKRFSKSDGVILEVNIPKSRTINSPDIFSESEVLIQGTIKNLKVTTP